MGDMIEVYKILYKKYDPLTTHNLFTLDTNNTRGHKLKLKKFQFNTDKYKHFFTNRVVNLWNSLPGEVVYAPSLRPREVRSEFSVRPFSESDAENFQYSIFNIFNILTNICDILQSYST